MMRRVGKLGLAAALVVGAAVLIAQDDDLIRVDVNLVNLFFTARDKSGGYRGDLKAEDITVLEDGKPQTPKVFTRETNLPLTIGLLVDVSRSQDVLIPDERRAGAQFFRRILRDKDLAFVISFGAEVELLQDYTSSVRLLEKGLEGLRLSAGFGGIGPIPTSNPKGTLLWDAVYLAANDQLKGQVGRKMLVVITDGVDQGSHYKLREAIDEAHRSDAIVYGIYYVGSQMSRMYSAYEGDLKKLAEESGGCVFDVDGRQSLDRIFEQIEQEMRSQYTVAYQSTNMAHDGAFRKVEIKPRDKNVKVQARRGYFAEGDDAKK
jgi:VWFA-related protein